METNNIRTPSIRIPSIDGMRGIGYATLAEICNNKILERGERPFLKIAFKLS
jgi:hypothetical protein